MIWKQIPEFTHSQHAALMRKGRELQEFKPGEESKKSLFCPQGSFYRFWYSGGHTIYIWWHRGSNGFVPLEKWRGLPGKLSLTVLWRGDKIIILSPDVPFYTQGNLAMNRTKGKEATLWVGQPLCFMHFVINKSFPFHCLFIYHFICPVCLLS